ncbi:ornithine--oxo-acid transaminase [Candidatus Formimonas warabiya]|uniref:Ornithine aminotransferase n=1 Tax=Formimonas warabiya TaxID=1761012 RepID=A0A3G1KVN4_FORW1|nr:ornithine--oxo-acid transaminase [Candidatus Formimonas warabiya]ATW26285.1 ornithine--oxo-acid transaminase [Candidatus Formimonas warabiya]
MTITSEIIALNEQYGARNYLPLPIVISRAEGVWVEDPEGKKYLDMLSCYSALNQGHRHPKIIQALKDQADKVTLTSRAFHNDQLGLFLEMVSKLTREDKVLPMNTGAEAVETALKAARRWGYEAKKITPDQAEIIVCSGNFHGRTLAAVSMSSEPAYKRSFGAFAPGFKIIPYGDIEAFRNAITDNTAALLIEPIQGEAGIVIPPDGFLKQAGQICRENNVLLLADEIQTGFGRTGKMFACDWEDVTPDIFILGKALGGGVFPISAIAANRKIMDLFEPGSHGSTFGGNPLACAVAIAAMKVTMEEHLPDRSLELGRFLVNELREINNPLIKEIRGKGLFVGMELRVKARPYCELLKEKGVLCKETHDNVIRFAPPLIITKEDLQWGIDKIKQALSKEISL